MYVCRWEIVLVDGIGTLLDYVHICTCGLLCSALVFSRESE
jgi:hypothetical protein